MPDFYERLEGARAHAAPKWSKEREHAALLRLVAKRGNGRAARRLAFAGAVLVAACVALIFARPRPGAPGGVGKPAVVAQTPVELLRLEDGSLVTARSAGARVAPIEIGPRTVTVRLTSGTATFSVTPNPDRVFRVQANDVTITVVGTVFSVGLEPGGVRVAVERGRVRVAWPENEREISATEQLLVASAENRAARAVDTPPAEQPAVEAPADAQSAALGPRSAGAARAPSSQPAARPDWRALAQDGDYGAALKRLGAEGPSAVRDEPGDLLLAADVARLGGHPGKAIDPLERVVTRFASDSRAPLAAFTLGRTLLDELGRPREAAKAFGRARQLDPRGALAEDALAREVESWSRAGEESVARDRAREYVAKYPKGRRMGAVKRLGGLD